MPGNTKPPLPSQVWLVVCYNGRTGEPMISVVNRCEAPWVDETDGAAQGRYVLVHAVEHDPELWKIVGGIMGAEGFDSCERRDRIIANSVANAVMRELTEEEKIQVLEAADVHTRSDMSGEAILAAVRKADAIRMGGRP